MKVAPLSTPGEPVTTVSSVAKVQQFRGLPLPGFFCLGVFIAVSDTAGARGQKKYATTPLLVELIKPTRQVSGQNFVCWGGWVAGFFLSSFRFACQSRNSIHVALF